jgi:hypothetical protein
VADDDGVALAQRADERGDVAGRRRQVVAARRLVAGAVAAQVGRDRPEPGRGEGGQLRPPGPPELREAVQQQDQRTLPGLGQVQPDTVGRGVAVDPGARQQDAGGVGPLVGGSAPVRAGAQTR